MPHIPQVMDALKALMEDAKGKGKGGKGKKGKGKDDDHHDHHKGKDKDKGKDKGKDKDKGPHASHYYIDGKIYDFSEWQFIHPGGDAFFAVSFQRDISAAVHAYHRNPDKLAPILEKYEVKVEEENPRDVLVKDMNAPAFILPPAFDARRDVPVYDWDKPFMKVLRGKINKPEMQKRIRSADYWFDFTAWCLFALHVFVCFPVMYWRLMPGWLIVFLQVMTRTALAGVGHYHIHRAKDGMSDYFDCFFDIQYVGASMVLADGHVMLHHLYTETPADVKRTVFNFMITIPRILRIPIFTAQKFGEFFTGHLLRFSDISLTQPTSWEEFSGQAHSLFHELRPIRWIMLAEMLWAALCDGMLLWCLQFFFTVWTNMFQIVASHDFEVVRDEQEYSGLDWGVFQVQHALDTYVTGIQHVDIFLTAGLGCHRAHHVLPYQKSGFANIASQPALMATCKHFDVEWAPARNLLLDRFLPQTTRH